MCYSSQELQAIDTRNRGIFQRYMRNIPWMLNLDAAINQALRRGEVWHILALEILKGD